MGALGSREKSKIHELWQYVWGKVVFLTGNQKITGVKAFASSPTVPTVTPGDNSTKAASTAYVDAAMSGSGYQPASDDLTAIANLTTTGYLSRTGAGQWALSASIPAGDVFGLGTAATHDVAYFVRSSEAGAPSGVATLDASGKLSQGQIPAVTITDTFVVASQAAMLSLVAERGDVVVRSDESQSYILVTEPASVLGNWQTLLTPASPVQSVFGRSGAVTANAGDYTFAQIGDKPTTLAGYGITNAASDTELTAGLAGKVDKVLGMGLSANDYTNADKSKLAGIAAGAEVNVQADWSEASTASDAYIRNVPSAFPPSSHTHSTGDVQFLSADRVLTSRNVLGGVGSFEATLGAHLAISGGGTLDVVTTAGPRLLGRYSTGAGPAQEITLGTGLSFSGSKLNATGGGGGISDAPNDGTSYARRNSAWSALGTAANYTIGTSGSTVPLLSAPANYWSGKQRISGEIQAQSANAIRLCYGPASYPAVIVRSDGSHLYFLLTDSGDGFGSWNSLRPFSLSLSTGAIQMSHGLTIAGGLTLSSGALSLPGTTGQYVRGDGSFATTPVGAQGPKGDKGDKGATGSQGPAGVAAGDVNFIDVRGSVPGSSSAYSGRLYLIY